MNEELQTAAGYEAAAQILFDAGDYAQALTIYERAAALDENYRHGRLISGIYWRLAEQSASAGDYDAAIDYYNQSITRFEKNYSRNGGYNKAATLHKQAEIYRLKGDTEQADKLDEEADYMEFRLD